MAARIVLASLERAANKHTKYIEPLVSLHIDFYVRVIVRVHTQAAEVKLSVSKLAHVFHCLECPYYQLKPFARARPSKAMRNDAHVSNEGGLRDRKSVRSERRHIAANEDAKGETAVDVEPWSYPTPLPRSTPLSVSAQPLDDVPRRCPMCSGRVAIAGPIYAAPSQNVEFIDKVLETMQRKGPEKLKAFARVQGLLQAAKHELPQAPLFLRVPDVASLLRMQVPPYPIVIGALCRLGYECSQVHCDAQGLKTTAPPTVVANVLRTYREKVLAEATNAEGGAVIGPLPEKVTATVIEGLDLTYDKQYDPSSKATGVVKFVPNPAFWGPRARHCGVAAGKEPAASE